MNHFNFVNNRLAVIGKFAKGSDVLDVGCVDARPDGSKRYQTTGLHIFLKKHARNIIGLDIDRQGVEVLSREGFDVVCGNAEDINLEKEFDCIVAGEVMEHLSNFGLFLDNMRQHLKSDGHLVVTVPNAFSISNFYRILRKNKIRVHEEHTCWFDPITLTQLFKRHNFIVVDITFSGNSKWYDKKYFLNIKYKIFRLACLLRDYFSPTVVIVAQKSFSSEVEDQE